MCETIDKTMRRKIIPYNPRLKQRARELRNNATRTEVILWEHLKGKQMLGYDFHRQKPLDEYIVDFFCGELCLAVEIDGSSHADRTEEDRHRQNRLECLGVNFLRYLDSDVKDNVEGVVASIRVWIEEHTPAFGHPSQEGNKKDAVCVPVLDDNMEVSDPCKEKREYHNEQSSKSHPKGGSTTAQSSGSLVKTGSTRGRSSKSPLERGFRGV